jgi:hypothetical protein
MTQVGEQLPSMWEALSSISSTGNKRKEKFAGYGGAGL